MTPRTSATARLILASPEATISYSFGSRCSIPAPWNRKSTVPADGGTARRKPWHPPGGRVRERYRDRKRKLVPRPRPRAIRLRRGDVHKADGERTCNFSIRQIQETRRA